MSPPRIVHILGNRWWSAISAYAVDLASAQASRGERVEMIPIADSAAERAARGRGVPIEDRFAGNAASEFAMGRRLRRRLHEGDVLHVHTGAGHAGAEFARMGRGVPLVRSRGDVRRPRGTPSNRWLYRRADALVLSGSFQRAAVAGWTRDESRVHVIPAPVDTERFRPLTDDARASARRALDLPLAVPLLGLIARFSPVKGHEVAIEALRHLRVKAHLLISGEPSQVTEADLRRWADHAGVSDRVHIRGRLDDVAAAVGALDVGIVASTGSEAICRIAGEMMATGTAVVATEVSVLPDMIESGRTGLLIPPGNALLLADALDRILASGERRAEMGRAARAWVESTCSIAVVTDAHEAVYTEVLR